MFGRGRQDVVAALVDAITGFLCIGIWIIASAAAIVWAMRPSEPEHPSPTFVRPGVPGHRKWKHNVFDDNAYAVLGVPQDANRAEIREAFRALTQRYHPDAVPAEEKERAALAFVHLDMAYELLMDPEMRPRYDAWIEYRDGLEPLLEEAATMLKTPDGRALVDMEISFRMPPDKQVPGAATSMPRPEVDAQPADPEELAPTVEPPATLPEVEMPDAVREALGLPLPSDRPAPRSEPET
jgi:hypothetical protein